MGMNKKEYEDYEARVKHGCEGLAHVSTGALKGCADCGLELDATDEQQQLAEEPGFSWHRCDCCDSILGGDRYPAHGITTSGRKVIVHMNVCADCMYYLNYERLDDATMMEIEDSEKEKGDQ